MKKAVSLLCALTLVISSFVGCAGSTRGEASSAAAPASTASQTSGGGEKKVLKVAALESAYGADMWKEVSAAFEKLNPDVKVELTTDKNIEDVISPKMKAGDYPDVVHLATGRKLALTETMIKEKGLADLTNVLGMQVPGETGKVSDKLVPGCTATSVTNPSLDGRTYLMPMFYGPCGLFYDAGLFKAKGWEVPTTWDEMWALGDKAKADGISLFTYPTTGYFDAFFYALLDEIGGTDFFNSAMSYKEGIWKNPEATQAFQLVGKLATYTQPTTVANANDQNYKKNQQLILDDKALFMPNGTWVTGEMKDAPRAKNFEWGFMALPAVKDGGDRYSFAFYEQVWVPAEAKNQDLAKQFIAYLYSDEAAAIFAKAGAIQPIKGISSQLTGENKLFYSIYDNGAKSAMGGFAATNPVEGVSMSDTLFGTVNSIVNKTKTVDQWQNEVEAASDKLRPALS